MCNIVTGARTLRLFASMITMVSCVSVLITPSTASAQVNCRSYGASPNDTADDTRALQTCFNANAGRRVLLDPPAAGWPGFIVSDPGLTIPSSGLTIESSQPSTRAVIIAGHGLTQFILQQLYESVNWTIMYVSFDGMNDTSGWRTVNCGDPGTNPGDLFLRGTGFTFAHNEIKHAVCGSGMQIAGSNYSVWDNYVAYNGTGAEERLGW